MAVSNSSVLEMARRAGRGMLMKSSATGGVPILGLSEELGVDIVVIPSLASKGSRVVALEVADERYHEGRL